MPSAAGVRARWKELNERQGASLQAIYAIDQAKEQDQHRAWRRGERPAKATTWRWIQYTGDTMLRDRLHTAGGLVDPGTGATFAALEQRGLIEAKYENEPGLFGEPAVVPYVKITPTGRRVVRAALGEQRERKPPAGTLQEWHWRALVLAYTRRPAGVQSAGIHYGRIGWNTWRRLRDYKWGALVSASEIFEQETACRGREK